MGRRQTDSEFRRIPVPILSFLGCVSIFMVYLCFSVTYKPSSTRKVSFGPISYKSSGEKGGEEEKCCRGIEHLELWGHSANWGSNFRLNSSKDCCMACKRMCEAENRPCLCNSWVFCGNKKACGSRFGEVRF